MQRCFFFCRGKEEGNPIHPQNIRGAARRGVATKKKNDLHTFILETSKSQSTNTNFPRIGRQLGVDPEVILATSHGRRSIDVLQAYDPSKANWECKSCSSLATAIQTETRVD